MSSIAFYAHKGGVGKSTLIFDVAYDLAINHQRTVYVIDTDSQLNTTFKLLKRSGYTIDNQLIDDLLGQNYQNLTVTLNQTTPQGGTVATTKSTLYSYLCGVNHPFNVADFITINGTNNKVKLLIGSPILHNLELQLINAIMNPQNNPATATVPLLFKNLVNSVKALQVPGAQNCVILVDMSPNSNYINQNILLSCDYFLLPCNADDNSMMSLKLLFNYLHTWRQQHNSYLPANHFVKFVCAILNRYKTSNVQNQTPTHMNRQFLNQISAMITQFQNRFQMINNQQVLFNRPYDFANPNKLLKVQNGMRFSEIASDEYLSIIELNQQKCSPHHVSFDPIKHQSMVSEITDITDELINNGII